jgi:hypothetical protein
MQREGAREHLSLHIGAPFAVQLHRPETTYVTPLVQGNASSTTQPIPTTTATERVL